MKLALARYLEVNEILIRKNPNKPTPKEILCRYVKMQMGFVARKLRNYISAYNISDKEKVLLFVTPKVRQLVKILKQYNGYIDVFLSCYSVENFCFCHFNCFHFQIG